MFTGICDYDSIHVHIHVGRVFGFQMQYASNILWTCTLFVRTWVVQGGLAGNGLYPAATPETNLADSCRVLEDDMNQPSCLAVAMAYANAPNPLIGMGRSS